MDWDKLRVFHAVAEAGSFTHAGHTLGLSQSAVSRQISGLETDLKVPLFHRHARGLILTEQGDLLYRTAHDVLTRLAATRTRLMDSREKPSGELRITTTMGLGSVWLTPRLSEFVELYPQINTNIVLDDRPLDLSMREADVAIRLQHPGQPDLIQRKLFTVHYHLYAAPEYIRANGIPETVQDLDRHKIITFGLPPNYLNDINLLETSGIENGSPRTPVLQVNSVLAQRRAVETGIGLAALPDYIVGDQANLIQIDLPLEMPEFDTYLVYPAELKQSKRVAVFREFIVSQARGWKF